MSFKEKEARARRRSRWEGPAAPTATRQPPITIEHFHDLLSDEPLDFVVIHHVALRDEKRACLSHASSLGPGALPLGMDFVDIKDGEGSKGPGATHRHSLRTPRKGTKQSAHQCLFLGSGSPAPPSHTQLAATRGGATLSPVEWQQEVLKWPMLHPARPVSAAARLPSPWSQAPRAVQGSPQALEIQGGLSLLQDPAAQRAPWSRFCQARQACRTFPSLRPGPSVPPVPDRPTRTGSHSPALPRTTQSASRCLGICPSLRSPASPSGLWPQHPDRLRTPLPRDSPSGRQLSWLYLLLRNSGRSNCPLETGLTLGPAFRAIHNGVPITPSPALSPCPCTSLQTSGVIML